MDVANFHIPVNCRQISAASKADRGETLMSRSSKMETTFPHLFPAAIIFSDMSASPDSLLELWLLRQLAGDAATWLREALTALAGDHSDRTFFKLFGFVPRKLGKNDMQLSADDLRQADNARSGWNPRLWSVDQAARVLLLLRSESDPEQLFARSEQLFATADMGELVALYRALPLYPEQRLYAKRGSEGIRTNMRPVFEAVAHFNPFPREQFDEAAWNQMVLKALFIDTPLWPIVGLDERANATLATMLVNYAHERWAAHRKVSPELWRCVGPFADEAVLDDLQKVVGSENEREWQAAELAVAACPLPRAKEMLAVARKRQRPLDRSGVSWEQIGRASS